MIALWPALHYRPETNKGLAYNCNYNKQFLVHKKVFPRYAACAFGYKRTSECNERSVEFRAFVISNWMAHSDAVQADTDMLCVILAMCVCIFRRIDCCAMDAASRSRALCTGDTPENSLMTFDEF